MLRIPHSDTSFPYTVVSGDTLSAIAEKHNILNIDEIQNKNRNLNPDSLSVGQVLRIPFASILESEKLEEEAWAKGKWSGDEDELMAMTLLGEGGTLPGGEEVMREVRTVIQNRMKYLGKSLHRIVFAEDQFEFWSGKRADEVIKSNAYGRMNKKMWQKALDIAKETSRDPDVSYSTHYWNPDKASPSWRYKIRVVHENKGKHVYGVLPDGSTLYKRVASEVSEDEILKLPLYEEEKK